MEIRRGYASHRVILLILLLGCHSKSIETSGFVEGEEFLVRSAYDARVEEVLVAEGQQVKPGQALATLNSETLLTSLKTSEAALSLLDAELERVRSLVGRLSRGGSGSGGGGFYSRVKKLYEVGGVSRAQLEQARKASGGTDQRSQADYLIKELEAKKSEAEANLAKLESFALESVLKSPAGGLVTKRFVQPGQVLSEGEIAFIVTDSEKVYLKATLPEKELARVQIGQKVAVEIEAFPDKSFEGELVQIVKEPEFSPTEVMTDDEKGRRLHSISVKIDNSQRVFKPGMSAKAKFLAGKEVIGGNSRKANNQTPGS